VRKARRKSLIVIDEAYAEFSNDPDGFLPVIDKVSNLVILRHPVKGARVGRERIGCVIGSEELIAALTLALPPYPIAQSAIRAAMDAFSPTGLAQTKKRLETIRQERATLEDALKKIDSVRRVLPAKPTFFSSKQRMQKLLWIG
jgi:histidinol-phosphate aminotransferase